MKVTGMIISRMAMEYRNGLMGVDTRESSKMAKNMERGCMCGLTEVSILADGKKIY